MIIAKKAEEVRCCGPGDCGLQYEREGARWCLGVECAGWRWLDVPNPAYQPHQSQIFPQTPNLPPSHIKSETHGYCGLAGRP